MIGPWCGRSLPRLYFHSAHGFATRALAHTLDSLVRVSRRVNWAHFVRVLRSIFPRSAPRRGRRVMTAGSGKPVRCNLPATGVPRSQPTLTRGASEVRPRRRPQSKALWHWTQSLPFQQFQALLTLFSKFFSSFPHGTCSLSVSCHYLALDGIYHPFRTALPSNSTRWEAIVRCIVLATNGVFTLHDPVFQLNSARHTTDLLSIDYNSNCCLIYKLSSSRFTRRYWGNPS